MVRSASRSSFLFEHDLFGKPDSTRRVKARGQAFPDHASRAKLAIDLENVCEPGKPPRRRARQLLHCLMSDYQL
jgi:hypothetical protein